jgi:uncharacterized protein YceK
MVTFVVAAAIAIFGIVKAADARTALERSLDHQGAKVVMALDLPASASTDKEKP